ncbi:hypothetical protein HNV12_00730 [Methanococcoides sp. SA1]|nr:hypothetical protein [Methanococcoides sp. SA1]
MEGLKATINARCIMYGGGPGSMYHRSFNVSGLNEKKVGLTYFGSEGETSVSIRNFRDLLPVTSSFPLETSEQVLNYFDKRIESARDTTEEVFCNKFNRVRAKYVLDAFETGKEMLVKHLEE